MFPLLRLAAASTAAHSSSLNASASLSGVLGSLLARAGSQALQHLHTGAGGALQQQQSHAFSSRTAPSCFSNKSSSLPRHQHHSQQQLLQPNTNSFHSSAAASSQCDCPTLGGPTPDLVTVEYDEDEVDRFIALADAIEEAFPNVVVEGNPSGPGRPGAFEVTAGANGAVIFSRLSSGSWPEAELVVDAVGAAAAACSLPQQQQL